MRNPGRGGGSGEAPMMPLEIENAHPSRLLDEARLTRALLAALAGERATLDALSVVLVDHDALLALNREHLGHDYHTDVLAYDLGAGDAVDGEIYVDLDTAAERCAEFGESYEREAARYAVHGLLHLIGYRDKTPEDKATMHTLESRYLDAAYGAGA